MYAFIWENQQLPKINDGKIRGQGVGWEESFLYGSAWAAVLAITDNEWRLSRVWDPRIAFQGTSLISTDGPIIVSCCLKSALISSR